MRKLIAAIVGTAIVSIACATSALATPRSPVWNWTGFYVGVNAGGAWNNAKTNSSTIFAPPADYFGTQGNVDQFNAVGAQRDRADVFTGGVQAGFNWQMGNLVTGIETDFQSFHQSSSGSASGIFPSFPAGFTISQSLSTDWLWTLRPRVGFAQDQWLFYATGGLAVTKLKASWNFVDIFGDTESTSLSQTRAGWTIGTGAEYALSKAWSLKAEYLYLNFGTANITTNNILDSGTFPVSRQPISHSVSLTSNVVRLGLNYRFGN